MICRQRHPSWPFSSHLQCHDRQASRVDIDVRCNGSLDVSTVVYLNLLLIFLFSLTNLCRLAHRLLAILIVYHSQFCDDVDQRAGVSDRLRWVDSSGGAAVSCVLFKKRILLCVAMSLTSFLVVPSQPTPIPPPRTSLPHANSGFFFDTR